MINTHGWRVKSPLFLFFWGSIWLLVSQFDLCPYHTLSSILFYANIASIKSLLYLFTVQLTLGFSVAN